MMNRVLFLYDMDSFTSPPTLPEVGLDGLASEKNIIIPFVIFVYHQYYTNYLPIILKIYAFSCKNQPGSLE